MARALCILLLVAAPTAVLAQTQPPSTIAVGDVAASVIQWTLAAFGPLISAAVLWLVVRLLNAAGIKNTDLLKDQLQRIIVNGVNAGAAKAMDELRGRGSVDVKSIAARHALWYAQTHGAGIIRALGLDPQSGEAVEAIKARIETALSDPATPTNPMVTPGSVTQAAMARSR